MDLSPHCETYEQRSATLYCLHEHGWPPLGARRNVDASTWIKCVDRIGVYGRSRVYCKFRLRPCVCTGRIKCDRPVSDLNLFFNLRTSHGDTKTACLRDCFLVSEPSFYFQCIMNLRAAPLTIA